MQAILLFSAIYIFLLFPIFVNCYFSTENENNKIYFTVSLFGINVAGGYAIFGAQGITFYSGQKRRPLIFEDFLMKRKKFSKVKGVGIYQIKSCIICGVKNVRFTQIIFFSKILQETLFPLIKRKHSYLRLNNDIALIDSNKVYFAISLNAITNILSLLLYLFFKLIKKVINGEQKQRTKSN